MLLSCHLVISIEFQISGKKAILLKEINYEIKYIKKKIFMVKPLKHV